MSFENRSGNYKTIDEKSVNSSLIKAYDKKYKNFDYFRDKVIKKHNEKYNKDDLYKIHNLFINWDKKILKSKILIPIFNGLSFYTLMIYLLLNHLGVRLYL